MHHHQLDHPAGLVGLCTACLEQHGPHTHPHVIKSSPHLTPSPFRFSLQPAITRPQQLPYAVPLLVLSPKLTGVPQAYWCAPQQCPQRRRCCMMLLNTTATTWRQRSTPCRCQIMGHNALALRDHPIPTYMQHTPARHQSPTTQRRARALCQHTRTLWQDSRKPGL